MQLRGLGLGHGVRFQKRIDQQMELARADAPSRMAVPSDLDAGAGLGFGWIAHERIFQEGGMAVGIV